MKKILLLLRHAKSSWDDANLSDYESGEDLGFTDDILESFLFYQQKIKQEFVRMQKIYGIIPIDGNRSIESVNVDLKNKIDQFLDK